MDAAPTQGLQVQTCVIRSCLNDPFPPFLSCPACPNVDAAGLFPRTAPIVLPSMIAAIHYPRIISTIRRERSPAYEQETWHRGQSRAGA